MPEERTGEKIYPPFPQTIEEAHSRGHIAKSAYLSAAILILTTAIYFKFFGNSFIRDFINALRGYLHNMSNVDGNSDILNAIKIIFTSSNIVVPFLIMVFGISLLINIIQSGFVFTTVGLEPNFERLDIFAGISRIFARRNLVRITIGVLVTFLVLGVISIFIYTKLEWFLQMKHTDFYNVVRFFIDNLLNLILMIGVMLLIISIADYIYQRWEYIQDLYLTKSEYMQELKRFEGDPRIKERWRQMHRELVRQVSLKKVPQATVVITNPTHISVALEYKISMIAPKVIAKGKGLLALKIRQIAKEHGIPIVEKPELARLLYKLNIGQYVPRDLYLAVAEVLRYVYMIKPALLGVTK